jgi:hypothetical protein
VQHLIAGAVVLVDDVSNQMLSISVWSKDV